MSATSLPRRTGRHSRLVTIRCTSCNGTRTVARETAIRVRAGSAPAACRDCRRPQPVARASDLRWWLARYGVNIGTEDPRGYVRAHGLPDGLRELVAGLHPGQDVSSPGGSAPR